MHFPLRERALGGQRTAPMRGGNPVLQGISAKTPGVGTELAFLSPVAWVLR